MQAVTTVVVDETSQATHPRYVSLCLESKALAPTSAVVAPARVLFVTAGRAHAAFHAFVADLTAHGGTPARITDVCMDLSPAYRRGAAETLPAAAARSTAFM